MFGGYMYLVAQFVRALFDDVRRAAFQIHHIRIFRQQRQIQPLEPVFQLVVLGSGLGNVKSAQTFDRPLRARLPGA